MIWLYNFLYKGQYVPQDGLKVIDSNARMEEIFEAQREEFERKNEELRQRLIEDFVESLDVDEEGMPIIPRDEDGEYDIPSDPNGIPLLFVHSDGSLADYPEEEEEQEEEEEEEPEGEEVEEEPEPEPEPEVDVEAILAEANSKAEAIIAEAKLRAKEALDSANMQADAMKTQAVANGQEEGLKKGYDEGFARGYDEASHSFDAKKQECEDAVQRAASDVENMKAQVSEARAESERVKAECAAREEDMEGRLVAVICDIIDKMFGIEFSDKSEILLHVVDHVITENPGSHEYLIRINEENYPILDDNREMLKEKVGQGVEIDLIKDPLLTNDQCMIETDGGVFNCGMDVQLNNLLNDLKALSLA